MSDLQCPVLVYVVEHREADERPAGVTIAGTYAWTASDAVDVRASLDDLADRHRGESVLVLVDKAQLATVESWARHGVVGEGGVTGGTLVLEGDADGWRLR